MMQNGSSGYLHSLLLAVHGFVFYLISLEINFKTRLFTLLLICSPPLYSIGEGGSPALEHLRMAKCTHLAMGN